MTIRAATRQWCRVSAWGSEVAECGLPGLKTRIFGQSPARCAAVFQGLVQSSLAEVCAKPVITTLQHDCFEYLQSSILAEAPFTSYRPLGSKPLSAASRPLS